MDLHRHKAEFEQLIRIVAEEKGIPETAVRRDYYIVMIMENLQNSEYADVCVFKGGTSLSKCYPGSIERFSEDIDLTFVPSQNMNDKKYSKELKRVEAAIAKGFQLEKIKEERNARNKSAYVWPEQENKDNCRIKLEIGSSVRPDPYVKMKMKTYIQEYLEKEGMDEVVQEFDLHEDLLYTFEKQNFNDAISTFEKINEIFSGLGE